MTEVGVGQRDVSLVEAIAWGTGSVALSNVIRIAIFELPAGGVAVRALHHAIELGHTILLGTLVAAVSVVWSRFGPKRRIFHALLVWVLAGLASQIVLVEDMQGPLEQLDGDPENALSLRALCAFSATPVAGAFLFGRLAARPRIRWVCVAAGARSASSRSQASLARPRSASYPRLPARPRASRGPWPPAHGASPADATDSSAFSSSVKSR
jgi:hypothetical protein